MRLPLLLPRPPFNERQERLVKAPHPPPLPRAVQPEQQVLVVHPVRKLEKPLDLQHPLDPLLGKDQHPLLQHQQHLEVAGQVARQLALALPGQLALAPPEELAYPTPRRLAFPSPSVPPLFEVLPITIG